MLECGDLRQYAIRQAYTFFEIEPATSISDITMCERFSHGDLLIINPEDLAWQNCQHSGFGGYGVFEVVVCVKGNRWEYKPKPQYKTGHVLFLGGSVQQIQQQAADWLRANQDLVNEPFEHRFGRKVTPILMALKNYEAYVPKEA